MSTRDPRTPTPQLALRIAAFGIVALGIFAVLFLRLWFLQVLQGEDYVAKATQNQERIVRISAPRGRIVASDGETPLVENRVATVASLRSGSIPAHDRAAILDYGARSGQREARVAALHSAIDDTRDRVRGGTKASRRAERGRQRTRRSQLRRELAALPAPPPRPRPSAAFRARLSRVGKLLHAKPSSLYRTVRDGVIREPSANVALKADVPVAVRNYLLQNPGAYPGVTVQRQYLRKYPEKGLAAQIFGGVGQITEGQLKRKRYDRFRQGQIIGQSGLEAHYNDYLQGVDGYERIQVDAQGQPTGATRTRTPRPGDRLKLTIDARLEHHAQALLGQATKGLKDRRNGDQLGGALVAMDPANGQVKAMASYPTFDPNLLSSPKLTNKRLHRIFSKKRGSAAVNRVTQSGYPTGSTFKIVTGSAALATGLITPETPLQGGDAFHLGPQTFRNAGGESFPSLKLADALTQSSDVAFYSLGSQLYGLPHQQLQHWANRYGFGRSTGIDLPGENPGTIPSRTQVADQVARELACRKKEKKPSCGIALPGAQFLQGNEVQFAIGQQLTATPMQLAVAYAGLYDRPGPTTDDLHFPVPHLGLQVQDPGGALLQDLSSKGRRTVAFRADWKRAIQQGLLGVTQSSQGTAAATFAGWNQDRFPVMAKTGTAQLAGQEDQAWFVAMVPDGDRPLVVAATVEGGGFGATGAAPMVCEVLRQYYQQPADQARCGSNGKAD